MGLALLLAGCVEVSWTRPDMTPESLRVDTNECAAEAQKQAQFDANNRAMETANTSQGSFGGSSAAVRGETQIAFQRAYQVHLASCMKGRGYEEVRETK